MSEEVNVKSSKPGFSKEATSKGALFWMAFPVVLLVVSSTGWLIMASIAIDDPGFAVERDYYKKASEYDDVVAQRAKNAQLGWVVKLQSFERNDDQRATLRLHLQDSEGHDLNGAKVRVVAFHNGRAADIQEITLKLSENGEYVGHLDRPRLGLWELRVSVEKGEIFTQVLRPELRHKSAGASPS